MSPSSIDRAWRRVAASLRWRLGRLGASRLAASLRRRLLLAALAAIYLLLLWPVGLLRRRHRRSPACGWNRAGLRTSGWRSCRISSSEPASYSSQLEQGESMTGSGQSAAGALVILGRQRGRVWVWLLSRLLLALAPLSEPPEREQLRADLYVLF